MLLKSIKFKAKIYFISDSSDKNVLRSLRTSFVKKIVKL